MSKKNSKKKVISLWIIALIILSGFYAGFYYAAHFNKVESTAESESDLNANNQEFFTSGLDQETTEQENTLDTETWYSDESVKITENFIGGYLIPETIFVSAPKEWDGYENIRPVQSDLFRVYSADNGYGSIGWYSVSGFASGAYYTTIEYSIDFSGTEGEFQIEYKLYVYDSTTWEDWTPTEKSKSVDIDSSYVSSNYRVRVLHKIWMDFGNGGFHSVYLLNLNTGLWVEVGSQDGAMGTVTDFSGQKIDIDVVKIDGDSISSDVRTELRYPSPTQKMHKIDYWVFSAGSTLYLYASPDYEFVSVNPTCTVEKETDYYAITNVLIGSYTFLFTSNCSYHLTIQDVSSSYLTNTGFENGIYNDDWTTNGTATVTTSQWFDGYYSLQTHTPSLLWEEYFTEAGDACDFEEDVDEFDIKLSGLDILSTITHASEDKLHLEETTGYTIGDGGRRDNLAIDTDIYTIFSTEIYLYKVFKPDRVKITLHFSDASTQDHVEMISHAQTVAFNFTITPGKTIEMIDIYYGDASYNNGVGDKIYISYIKIFHEWIDPYEISLSLPLPFDDYYFSFAVRSEETTTINIAEIDRDIEITLLDTWEQVFYYAHTDSVTLSITPYSLTSLVFFDNFQIAQTSTEIRTDEPSKSLITSRLRAWDGRKNPLIPNENLVLELWDRCDTDQIAIYETITNEYGLASWQYEYSLEHKEHMIIARHIKSDFNTIASYHFEENGLDSSINNYDWTMGTNDYAAGKYGYAVDGIDNYGDLADNDDFDFTDTENLYIACWIKTTDTYSYQRIITKRETTTAWYSLYVHSDGTVRLELASDYAVSGYQSLLSDSAVNDGEWHYIEVERNVDDGVGRVYIDYELETEVSLNDASGGDLSNAFDIELLRWDNTPAQNYSGLVDHLQIANNRLGIGFYFTPSNPTETDYMETVILDSIDFSEGNGNTSWVTNPNAFEDFQCDSSVIREISNGMFIQEIDSALKFRLYPIGANWGSEDDVTWEYDWDFTYYEEFQIRIWSNISYTVTFRIEEYYGAYGSNPAMSIPLTANEWTIFTYDISEFERDTDGVMLWGYGSPNVDCMMKVDYILINHKDSWLEETNNYATDELLDAWDFEEYDTGTVLDGWQESTGAQDISLEDGSFKVDITAIGAYTRIVCEGLSIDSSIYDFIAITIMGNEDDLQVYFAESGNQGITSKTAIGSANTFHTLTFVITDADWSGTETKLYIWFYDSSGDFEGDEFFWIDSIKLLSLEELSYSTIQNSVLLESETNDLLYDLFLDWNFVGTFSDLSLIPLISSVGTHYLQVQPYRTDSVYLTQNIYTYYYEVDPPAFSVNIESFYVSDTYINSYATSNKDYTYSIYENNVYKSGGSGNFEGTTISSERTTTQGVTIEFAIKFVNDTSTIWFNTSYSNADSTFYVTYYNLELSDTEVIITWDTTKDSIDYLTIFEDGVEKVSDDPDSTSSYTKSEGIGNHYVTLVFEAAGYDTIIFDFSYTIVSDDPNFVEVAFFSYSILGTINILLLTHWGNQTIDIYDNATLIAEDYTEGTIICFFTIEEGFHNISIEIWNGAELWQTLLFGFTIDLEFEALTINYFFFDVNEETYSVGFSTNWFNQTAYVYENDVLQETVEEYITEVYDRPQDYGVYYNITVVINSYVYQFGFQNPAAPEVIDNYLINLEYDYDLSGSLNILIYTYFGNQTIDIYDNATLLVDDSSEGDITTTYLVEEGYHNITVEIYNGGDLWRTFQFGFIIDFAEEIYDVHIDLFSQVGLGIQFSEAKCYMNYVNDAYRLNQDFETTLTSFTIHIVDYFNTTLKTYIVYDLNSSVVNYLEFMIMYYEFELENPYNCIVIVELERNDHLVYFTLNANETIRFYISEGEYTISCAPFNSADFDGTNYEFETSYKLAKHTIMLDMTPTAYTFNWSAVWGTVMGILAFVGVAFGAWRAIVYLKRRANKTKVLRYE